MNMLLTSVELLYDSAGLEVHSKNRTTRRQGSHFPVQLCCVQVSATRGAAGCGDRNCRQAMRTILFPGIFLPDFVGDFHDQKNHERNDYKIDDIVEEGAVSNDLNGFGLCIGERNRLALRVIEDQEQAGEIDFAE